MTGAVNAVLNQSELVSRAKLIYQSPAPIGSWGGADVPLNGCGYHNCSSGQGPYSHGPLPSNPPFVAPDIKIQAWAKPIGGGAVALVVFNRDGRRSNPLNLTTVDLDINSTVDKVAVKDLFNHSTETLTLRHVSQHQSEEELSQSGAVGVLTVKAIGPHDSVALLITPLSLAQRDYHNK
jgi:hypothetical protein